jgi:hypothetical protein
MGRQERRDDRSARNARDEATVKQVRKLSDAFCPACGVWYPVASTAHAGH